MAYEQQYMTECTERGKAAVELVVRFLRVSGVILDHYLIRNHMQLTHGDVCFQGALGLWKYLEVKGEKRYTGRVFLEIWCRYQRNDKRKGWMFNLQHCDVIAFYFFDRQTLVTVDFKELSEWYEMNQYRFKLFPLSQSKADKQDGKVTWGKCVPIAVLQRELKSCKVYEGVE